MYHVAQNPSKYCPFKFGLHILFQATKSKLKTLDSYQSHHKKINVQKSPKHSMWFENYTSNCSNSQCLKWKKKMRK